MNKESFNEWRNSPTTVEIYKKLEEVKQALVDGLADGQTLSISADETHGNTAKTVGRINGLNQLLNITYETEEEANE